MKYEYSVNGKTYTLLVDASNKILFAIDDDSGAGLKTYKWYFC